MNSIFSKSSFKGGLLMVERKNELNELMKRLDEMLKTLAYGSITIIVQDGKVVQLEKHEKMRIRNAD